MTQVVLASHNAHKLEELRRILGPLVPGIELIGYDGPEPVENGLSFEENALLKARAAAAYTGLPAIADDSGISVAALNGCPGIFSARWGGPERSDRANVELLLWQMSDIADEHRAASFVCTAALAMPVRGPEPVPGRMPVSAPVSVSVSVSRDDNQGTQGTQGAQDEPDEIVLRGEWPGSLLREAAGEGGFGYDPVFLPEGETRSAAELSADEKDAVSHRRRAFTALAPELLKRLG